MIVSLVTILTESASSVCVVVGCFCCCLLLFFKVETFIYVNPKLNG